MSMPSWEVHEKYAKLMGIPIEIAKEINKLIDDLRWHDFFDSAVTERISTPDLRVLRELLGSPSGRIIVYNFDSALFYTPTWEPFRQRIEAYGNDGLKAFFLHMSLDLIERNERGRGFAAIEINDVSGFYREYIDEVEKFLQDRIDEVLADIWEDVRRREERKHSRF